MMGETSFQSLDLDHVQGQLLSIYERIACEKGRVEIVRNDGACDCVLISKAELESLERAIEVLSDSEGVRELTVHLANLAQLAESQQAGASL